MILTVEKIDAFKEMSAIFINQFPDGAIFFTSDPEKVTWKIASSVFDIADFSIGAEIKIVEPAYRAIQTGQEVQEYIPYHVYGIRVFMHALPVFKGTEVIGSTVLVLPRMHPIARSFGDFAPIIADMFPEGSFIFGTSTLNVTARQRSIKFDIPELSVGTQLRDDALPKRAMQSKQLVIQEVESGVYGVPVRIMSNPLFDQDDASRVVGTFNIAVPRESAMKLRTISTNVSSGLEEVSAASEELAASASQINVNETELYQNIQEVNQLADSITEILDFIKQIADETKILGLNAAVEAARAGDAGRGFGVVADEIRKLSDESKKTVADINKLLKHIKSNTEETAEKSRISLNFSQEQAAATEEIAASVGEIRIVAETLDRIAQDM